MSAIWGMVRAPLITAAAAILLELMRGTPLWLPNAAPVLLVIVVYATYNWGVRDGVLSGLIAVFYALIDYSADGQLFRYNSESIRGLVGYLVLAGALLVVLTRWKYQNQRALVVERRARERIASILESKQVVEDALRSSEERYRELFENANDMLYIHDLKGSFTAVNHACARLTGYTQAELVQKKFTDLIGAEYAELHRQMLRRMLDQGGATTYDVEIIARDERRIAVEVSTRLVYEQGRPIAVQGIARDISERKRAEEALRNASLTDPLTGVYNRRGAVTLADQQLKIAQRLGRAMLLLYADVNHLKEINDTHGHTAGDTALIQVAQVLQETFRRESDLIARMGGDEFIVLAMESAGSTDETLRRRLADALAVRNLARSVHYPLSVSLGVARYDPLQPTSFEQLLAEADERMYSQKKKQLVRG